MLKRSIRLPDDNRPELNLGDELSATEMRSPRSITRCFDAWDDNTKQCCTKHRSVFTFSPEKTFRASTHRWFWVLMSKKIQKNYSNDSLVSFLLMSSGAREGKKVLPLAKQNVMKKRHLGRQTTSSSPSSISPEKLKNKVKGNTFSHCSRQNSSCMRWPPNGIFALDFWRLS